MTFCFRLFAAVKRYTIYLSLHLPRRLYCIMICKHDIFIYLLLKWRTVALCSYDVEFETDKCNGSTNILTFFHKANEVPYRQCCHKLSAILNPCKKKGLNTSKYLIAFFSISIARILERSNPNKFKCILAFFRSGQEIFVMFDTRP